MGLHWYLLGLLSTPHSRGYCLLMVGFVFGINGLPANDLITSRSRWI